MALFGAKDEPTKKEMKLLDEYGLETLTDRQTAESIKKIEKELAGSGLMSTAFKLGGGNEKDVLKTQLYLQKAIFEQNWIIIRELDRIAALLDK